MISKDSPDYRSINFGKTLIWSVQLPCCWWRSFLLSLISQTWWQSQRSHYLSWNVFVIESLIWFVQGGGSSPWLSEFETFLGKLDRENLARATKPNPHQPQGNQDCQLKPQLPSESQYQGQLAEEERSIAWRVPLLHFVVEARTVLNVTTTDDRVRRTVLETFDKIHCKCRCRKAWSGSARNTFVPRVDFPCQVWLFSLLKILSNDICRFCSEGKDCGFLVPLDRSNFSERLLEYLLEPYKL